MQTLTFFRASNAECTRADCINAECMVMFFGSPPLRPHRAATSENDKRPGITYLVHQ